MIRTLLKPLSFIPAILLMMMIYHFSAQPAEVSSQLSYKVSYKIVEIADYVFETNLDYWQMDEWAQRINGVTRKLAHMTEYFALAIAVSFPLYVYGVHGIWLMLLAGMICVGFAAGDEYHQSFIEGRTPSRRDVGIDSFGVFWGIILVRIIGWTGRKTIFRPGKKKIKTERIYSNTPDYNYNNYPNYYSTDQDLPPYIPGNSYPPQMNANDFDHEGDSSDEKESFFMKSAYDGKPKPYDPKDPFQDWMDDYFPEDEDSSR